VLEEFEARPDFEARWRGFLRDCALLVIPRLSPEFAQLAAQCCSVADAFDNGRADRKALSAVLNEAGQFWKAHRDSSPATDVSGLLVLSVRLGTTFRGPWWGLCSYLFAHLDDSGVPESQWFPLFLKRFEGLVSGPANPV